jgi:sigma-E factor negative regulatory protein RseC
VTQTVRVVESDNNGLCTVELTRESACGGHCASCGGCDSSKIIKAVAHNRLGAVAGDLVVVESSKKDIFGIAAFVYMLPVLMLIACYLLADSLFTAEYAPGLCAAAGFLIGLACPVIYAAKRKEKVYLTVTQVLERPSQSS